MKSQHDLPDHLSTPRPHQIDAVDEIAYHYETGKKLVLLDAPTGSGKTLIAEMARRELRTPMVYTATTKALQEQFLKDFSYARVLKGRRNYPVMNSDKHTADDCTGRNCWLCDGLDQCPYQIAKIKALGAEVAVLNLAYFLRESNFVGSFGAGPGGKGNRPDLVILDECDELERALMGFIEWTSVDVEEVGMEVPKKGARRTTIIRWLEQYVAEERRIASFEQGVREALSVEGQKKHMARLRHIQDTEWVAAELAYELELNANDAVHEDDGDGEGQEEPAQGHWIRDYDRRRDDRLTLKPATVDRYGQTKLWRHSDRWLCMSASIISPETFVEELGWTDDYAVVEVPMTFPVANRPIYAAPIARVVNKEMDEAIPKMQHALERLVEMYPNDRVLVHTVSYKLTGELYHHLRFAVGNRPVITYTKAHERDNAMARYERSTNGILIAPSMARGYDFKDDLARVVVLCKVPYPNLGDRQVSARMRLPGGRTWYDIQTVREIVQMTGRGVRSSSDWAHTFILDASFSDFYRKNSRLFPKWWREAVDGYPTSKLKK